MIGESAANPAKAYVVAKSNICGLPSGIKYAMVFSTMINTRPAYTLVASVILLPLP